MSKAQRRTRLTRITVVQDGESIESDGAKHVAIEQDHGLGEVVIVSSDWGIDRGRLRITPAEWPELREAIERMVSSCTSQADQ